MGIGERLREERKRLELKYANQTKFAEAAGVKKNAQSNYENNIRAPDTDYLKAIEAMGCDVLYVVTGRRNEENITREDHHGDGFYAKARAARPAEPLNLWERSVLDCMRQLKPEHQRMIEGIAQSILKTQQEQEVIDDFVTGKKSKGQDEEWWPDPTVKND